MALIVSLDRGAIKLDLGDFRTVELSGDEVKLPEKGGKTIARHLHNRWLATEEQKTPSSAFLTLESPVR